MSDESPKTKNKRLAPKCPKCGLECDEAVMEAILAPPAPTLYLTTWSCSGCKKKAEGKV